MPAQQQAPDVGGNYKMKRKYFLIVFFLLTFSNDYAQSQTDTDDIVYQAIPKDYLKQYSKASFVVDYFFTNGWSINDRYHYEIIVTDSLLTLNFYSPKSDSYKHVVYNKKKILNASDLNKLKQIIKAAQVKQSKEGIPEARFSAYTQEVLIVHYNNISIAGGLAYGNIATYSDSEPKAKVNEEITDDRNQSSSISGNYDLLISALKKLFVELDKLKKQSIQE